MPNDYLPPSTNPTYLLSFVWPTVALENAWVIPSLSIYIYIYIYIFQNQKVCWLFHWSRLFISILIIYAQKYEYKRLNPVYFDSIDWTLTNYIVQVGNWINVWKISIWDFQRYPHDIFWKFLIFRFLGFLGGFGVNFFLKW